MDNKIICTGQTAQDCWKCNKMFSSRSSHFDKFYNCRVEEITCAYGGHRIFKDEGNQKQRLQ